MEILAVILLLYATRTCRAALQGVTGLSLSVSLCLSLSVCLSLSLSLSLSVSLSLSLSLSLPLSLCLSVSLSVCLSLSVSVSLCLSLPLSVCLSLSLRMTYQIIQKHYTFIDHLHCTVADFHQHRKNFPTGTIYTSYLMFL